MTSTPTRWYTRRDTGERVPIGWWSPTPDGGWRDVTPRWLTPVPPDDLDRDGPCPMDPDVFEAEFGYAWDAEFDDLGRPNRGTGNKLANFTEDYLRCTKDSVGGKAGTPLRPRPWQRELHRHIFARRARDAKLRHRTALVGMPRKNGKSEGIAAPPVIYNLLYGPQGGEIYSCAADRDQAKIVFGSVKRMVELNQDELGEFLEAWASSVTCAGTASFYKPVSRDAYTKEGYNPSLVPFDEVHAQPDRELWDVMDLAMGARGEPMLLGITTAGVKQDRTGEDSIAYTLYQLGCQIVEGEIEDDTFFMAWWEAAKLKDPCRACQRNDVTGTHDHGCWRAPSTWAEANPGFDDIVSAEDFASKIKKTPEHEFRTKRLNQWQPTSANKWMTEDTYNKSGDLDVPVGWLPDSATTVVLSFDGSFNFDSTGLTIEPVPERKGEPTTMGVVALWERPPTAKHWQVDQDEVEAAIRAAFERWDVRVLAYDRRLWVQLFERLAAEGYKVEPMPQGEAMIQAAQRAYEDMASGKLRHNRDPRLKRHFMNATGKQTPTGIRVQKETPKSKEHIDLAVAGIQGHAFASRLSKKRAPLVS